MLTRVYFSVADRPMENFLTSDAFERSLIFNVLFEQGILITDILCAISGGLERHLEAKGSLFELCVQEGIIVPAFRVGQTFLEAFESILRQQVLGVRPSAQNTMRRLQEAADRNPSFSSYTPLVHLGDTFDKRVQSTLGQPQAPLVRPGSAVTQQEMDRLWQLTREWRIVCTNEAREAVYRLGEKGTRRGEIVKAVARNLAPGTDPKIDDIGELLTRFPARRYELRAFFKWVSELYLYNHARQMQAIPNLPAYNALTSVLLDREPSGPSLLVEPAAPSLTELIEVPPLRVLRKVPPQVLIDIRNDKGAEYLAALSAWHEKPQDAGRSAALQKALKKYGQQLVKWSGGDTKTLMQVVFGGLSASGRRMIEGAIAAALANLRAYPKLSSYGLVGMAAISVAELTYAAYLWAWQSPEEQTLELMAPNLEESEVNVPKQESISE